MQRRRRETSHAERVEMIERHGAGESLAHIAQELNLSVYTVRVWWRAYRDGGWAALEPGGHGPPAVGPLGQFHSLVKYVALRLKREHPGWGPVMICLHLRRRASLQGLALPRPTAVWSYLHPFGTRLLHTRRARTQRPAQAAPQATAAHQRWQLDFKGDEPLVAHTPAIIAFGVTDEASGAPLGRFLHAASAVGNRAGLSERHVQAWLRETFARWGLPDAVRMDRDPVLIGSARLEWPGLLLLWLVGLAIQPIINRAYRPTDNALIERAHRTWCSDVTRRPPYADAAALQVASDQALQDRCLVLPSRHAGCAHRAPALAFPELLRARRPYQRQQERMLFELSRVDHYLAQWEWSRRVDSVGKISLGNHNLALDSRRRGQTVKVRFDPALRAFVIATPSGEELRRHVLQEVSLDYLLGKGV